MPYQWVTHTRSFVPDEAHSLAALFRAQAAQARELGQQLERAAEALGAAWEGSARERFFMAYEAEPRGLADFARQLEHLAAACERLCVVEIWSAWEWLPGVEGH